MQSRIMYIECKSGPNAGLARIGRVRFSRSGRTIYYQDLRFQSLAGRGFKANYFEIQSGDEYWISGCKKTGRDQLYSGSVMIDDDVREEYWLTIRRSPSQVGLRETRREGKYRK